MNKYLYKLYSTYDLAPPNPPKYWSGIAGIVNTLPFIGTRNTDITSFNYRKNTQIQVPRLILSLRWHREQITPEMLHFYALERSLKNVTLTFRKVKTSDLSDPKYARIVSFALMDANNIGQGKGGLDGHTLQLDFNVGGDKFFDFIMNEVNRSNKKLDIRMSFATESGDVITLNF